MRVIVFAIMLALGSAITNVLMVAPPPWPTP